VTNWKECLNNNAAWDTLTWFAALIAMAAALNKFGFIPWLSTSVVQVGLANELGSEAEICVWA
jgi:di/tricarboxylate transporter